MGREYNRQQATGDRQPGIALARALRALAVEAQFRAEAHHRHPDFPVACCLLPAMKMEAQVREKPTLVGSHSFWCPEVRRWRRESVACFLFLSSPVDLLRPCC
jgi:hypothetical protein